MDAEYCGKVVRLMMCNHARDRATPKAEIAETLSVPAGRVNAILLQTASYLSGFALEIVGAGCGEDGRQVELADRVFLRRRAERDSKQARHAVSDCERRQYLLFSVIQVENNSLDSGRLGLVAGARCFEDVDIGDFVKRQRSSGYLSCRKVDDVLFWSLGWRYYAEFGDTFDVAAHFGADAPVP